MTGMVLVRVMLVIVMVVDAGDGRGGRDYRGGGRWWWKWWW